MVNHRRVFSIRPDPSASTSVYRFRNYGLIRTEHGEMFRHFDFASGIRFHGEDCVCVDIVGEGPIPDLGMAIGEIPIVSPRLAKAIATANPQAIQRIPIHSIAGDGEVEMLNILTRYDCVDQKRSGAIRPQSVCDGITIPGSVFGPVLRSDQIGDAIVFRLSGFPSWVVAQEQFVQLAMDHEWQGFSVVELPTC